ncbi:MAG: coproporphyrinogen III oxidase, partial [Bacteroidetes bacterium HGW-Bacteroidetes-19]
SNFAIQGFESKHNSNYWNGTHYLGLGPSAHSYDGDFRSWNVSSLTKYVDGIVHGKPIIEYEKLTISDKFNEAIMLGIRTSKGVLISEISKKYGEAFVQHLLHQLVTLDSDLYELSEGVLTVTEKGFPLLDHITEILFISED